MNQVRIEIIGLRAILFSNRILFGFLVIYFIFISTFSLASTNDRLKVNIISDLSNTGGRLGDKLTITYKIDHPSDWRLLNPEIKNWGEDVHIFKISTGRVEEIDDNRAVSEVKIEFSVFQVGGTALKPIIIRFRKSDGNIAEYKTIPINLYTESMLTGEEKDIRDIKGPRTIEAKGIPPVLIIIIIAVLLAAAVLILLHRKRKSREVGREKELEPAHIEAYRELDRLSRENLLARGSIKLYYVKLAEIIKRYIAGRFGFDTIDKTTDEIMREIKKQDINRESRHTLDEFFEQCDLVKFAKYIPTGSQAREALEAAYLFVDGTREEPVLTAGKSPIEEKHPGLRNGNGAKI